jgi:FtsH-binding integral membrane protein
VNRSLCLFSTTTAAIVSALAAHALTASSSLWYLRTLTVMVTAGLAAWSVATLFRQNG